MNYLYRKNEKYEKNRRKKDIYCKICVKFTILENKVNI